MEELRSSVRVANDTLSQKIQALQEVERRVAHLGGEIAGDWADRLPPLVHLLQEWEKRWQDLQGGLNGVTAALDCAKAQWQQTPQGGGGEPPARTNSWGWRNGKSCDRAASGWRSKCRICMLGS